MKISLAKIKAKSAERPSGYLEEYLSLGKIEGEYLILSVNAHRSMLAKYAPDRLNPSTISPQPSSQLRGIGDVVALIAKPIARAIDKVAGTDLKNCQNCNKNQDKLNAAVPFKRSKKQDKAG